MTAFRHHLLLLLRLTAVPESEQDRGYAEAIRDEMDTTWHLLSADDHALIRQLAARLNQPSSASPATNPSSGPSTRWRIW